MSKTEPPDHVRAAIEKALDDYLEDRTILHFDRGAARAAMFSTVARLNRARKTARRCMAPECSEMSLTSSHTIPRSSSVSVIARKGHVMTPAFSHTEGSMTALRVGAGRAGVFPGFCKEHELLFQPFERRGKIENDVDVARQLFRAICREIVRLEIEIAQIERGLADYREYRRKALERLIRQRVPEEAIRVTDIEARDGSEDLGLLRLEQAKW